MYVSKFFASKLFIYIRYMYLSRTFTHFTNILPYITVLRHFLQHALSYNLPTTCSSFFNFMQITLFFMPTLSRSLSYSFSITHSHMYYYCKITFTFTLYCQLFLRNLNIEHTTRKLYVPW